MPTVTCPNPTCRHPIEVSEDLRGQTITCPQCTTEIVLPGKRDGKGTTIVDALGPGAKFAHYEIIELIGTGGMGRVYKARNLRLNKVVALKILSEVLAGRDQVFVERFLREAQSGARLEHPNVVPIYFVGAADDQYFIEMQYVEGRTLGGIIRKGLKPDVIEVTRIILEAAKGIGAAHDLGIIHRDIKPENIMIDEKGNAKVTDFGLAKILEDATTVTVSGHIMGTPNYMSPEQCGGQPTDARSDIYALGATYFHAVTNHLPYASDTILGLIHHHTSSPVPNPKDKNPNVPDTVTAVIRRAMAKRPEYRYQSCAEMIEELQKILDTRETVVCFRQVRLPKMLPKPVGATPAPQPAPLSTPLKKSSSWASDAIALGVVAAVLAGLGYGSVKLVRWWRSSPSATETETETPSTRSSRPARTPRTAGPGMDILSEQWGEWQELFNSRDLDGWSIESGNWKVQDGALVGLEEGDSQKRIACSRDFSGSGIVLEYAVRGSGALGAWVEANGQRVLFGWGGDCGDRARVQIDDKPGEQTTVRVDPDKTHRIQIRLDGDWVRYTIDHNKPGPEPLKLSREGNTFRIGLATDTKGAHYESVRAKILTVQKPTP